MQRAGALSITSCSQPFSARTATVPPMQARFSPSRRALLGPGRLTGSSVGNALHGNLHLFAKVYFPRLIAPLAVVASNLIPFAIQLVSFAVTIRIARWQLHVLH